METTINIDVDITTNEGNCDDFCQFMDPECDCCVLFKKRLSDDENGYVRCEQCIKTVGQ